MSTPNVITPTPLTPPPPPDPDPFRYGWRYVEHRRPDGGVDIEEVPLTLEDVLHPQEDDVIAENTLHQPERDYLADVCRTRQARVPRGFVFSDCLLDFNVAGIKPMSPDVSVVEDINTLPLPTLGTYRFAVYGGRCVLALEIVSPDTRKNDVDRKPELYHRCGVQQYVIIDQARLNGPRWIISRVWSPDSWVTEDADVNGRVRLHALGLLLGLRDGHAYVVDVETGEELRDYPIEYAARLKAEDDARKEQQARQKAEDDARKEQQARQKAEDDARKERLARQQAEERLRELEAKLRERDNSGGADR